jgi:hypothetical protein
MLCTQKKGNEEHDFVHLQSGITILEVQDLRSSDLDDAGIMADLGSLHSGRVSERVPFWTPLLEGYVAADNIVVYYITLLMICNVVEYMLYEHI